jgi:hypothetical protein
VRLAGPLTPTLELVTTSSVFHVNLAGPIAPTLPVVKVALRDWVQVGEGIWGDRLGATVNNTASVSMSSDGSRIALGRSFDNNTGASAVSVHDWDGVSWVQSYVSIEQTGAAEGGRSAIGLAGDKSRLIYGARFDDSGGTEAGLAAVYDLPPTAALLVPGSFDQGYSRGTSQNADSAGMSALGVIYPTSGDNLIVDLFTWTDGDEAQDFDLNLQLVELPTTTRSIIVEATTGNFNPATATDFAFDTNPQIDTNVFTHTPGGSEITVDVAGDYLVAGGLASRSFKSNRNVPALSFRVNNVEDASFGGSAYNRGNSGSGHAAIATSGLLSGLSASDQIELYANRLGTSSGAIENDIGALTAIQLSSLSDRSKVNYYNGTVFVNDVPVKYRSGSYWIDVLPGRLKYWDAEKSTWVALN